MPPWDPVPGYGGHRDCGRIHPAETGLLAEMRVGERFVCSVKNKHQVFVRV